MGETEAASSRSLDFRLPGTFTASCSHICMQAYVARSILTQLQRQSDVDILLRGMLGGTADVENYCSLTLSARGEDIAQSEIE